MPFAVAETLLLHGEVMVCRREQRWVRGPARSLSASEHAHSLLRFLERLGMAAEIREDRCHVEGHVHRHIVLHDPACRHAQGTEALL